MDKLEVGVPLIRKISDRVEWLGRINRSKQQIEFLMANRLEKESWRDAIMRDVAWELDLDRKLDMLVSKMAQLHLEFDAVLPGQVDSTRVICAFYNIEFYRKSAKAKVEANQDFIWLTSTEICAGVTDEGMPIDPLLLFLNGRAQVIQHWETDAM